MGMIINPYLVQPSGDADAQAFITAAGITDNTQKSAIETLVTDLKGYGIWTKMSALYPFVGGTATTHKYNLKNPLDTDAAFRLVFNGGWTHSSNGVLPNGTNGYADTKLVPNTSLTFNNTHLSLYSRTNIVTNAWNGASNSYLPIFAMMLRSSDNPNLVYFDGYDYSAHRISATNTDSRGLFIASITSSTSQKIIKNGSVLVTNTTAQTQSALPSYSMYLGNRNDAGTITGTYDNKELAFASIGDGLNDTEAANFYTAVQAFQTTLSRNV